MNRQRRNRRINRAAGAIATIATFGALITACMNNQANGDAAPIITTDSPSSSGSTDQPTTSATSKPVNGKLAQLANPCRLVTAEDLKQIFKPYKSSLPDSEFVAIEPNPQAYSKDPSQERNCVYESENAYVDDGSRYSRVSMTLTIQTELDPSGDLWTGAEQFAVNNGGTFVPIIGVKGAYSFADGGKFMATKHGILIEVSALTDPVDAFKVKDSRRIIDVAVNKLPY